MVTGGSGRPTFSNADSIPSETSTADRSLASTSASSGARSGAAGRGSVTTCSMPSLLAIMAATMTSGWLAKPCVRARNGTWAAVSAAAISRLSFPPVRDSSTGTPRSPSGRTASTRAAATAPYDPSAPVPSGGAATAIGRPAVIVSWRWAPRARTPRNGVAAPTG